MGLISYFSLDDDDYDSDDDDEQKYIRHDTEILNSDTFKRKSQPGMLSSFFIFHMNHIQHNLIFSGTSKPCYRC